MMRERDGREEGELGRDLGDNCVGSEMCVEWKRWWGNGVQDFIWVEA